MLGKRPAKALPDDWVDCLLAESMADGGMGSLRLKFRGRSRSGRFREELGVCQFTDTDGIAVVATLYGNDDGLPFELDVWKVDFSPLLRVPENLE
ncbi:MAG: hypothetical protein HY902_14180 [Deltaproteobacteria bacterium]|nr:hypothetical protein [Deltaproteobacteria bacterium]